MAKAKVAIIGPGAVGRAIGRLLRQKQYTIAAVAGRSHASAQSAVDFIGGGRAANKPATAARGADIIFITTPDRAIETVCETLAAAKAVKRGAAVFHCSGAHGPDILASARTRKAHVAALHPLQSFASPEQAVKRMKGSFFTLDGDPHALPVAEKLVKALGGSLVKMPPRNRAMYHAALCVLSNYLVAIADLGQLLMGFSGMAPDEIARAVSPLLKGTIENVNALGPPAALTGPIARGDIETVERHLHVLRRLPRPVHKLYCQLGLYTVRVAQRKGTLHAPEARHLIRILTSRP